MSDAALHLAFAIRISRAAGHHDSAVVCQHVAVQRIQSGIVNVGLEDAYPWAQRI